MSDPIIPSAEQLAESRREHWHQAGNPLLTMESLLPWLQTSGLVLFAPRGQQFPCPAPTLVEAVLGAPTPASSVADREPARSLLGRMVAEGTALPLNLLGAPGTTPDEPDFVVATAVFAYLFTLRGDKAFKQLPSSSGPFKVSPLAVNTYTMLSESGPRSAADLANELGKGLTEAAVLRALSELWQHLRVFPVAQSDGATLWELATARFTKAIKSGANAGQPSALSALITLYLGQAVLATADDVELFLSPLAPRSRVRDVVHALTAARELGELVVEGKHVLHVTGDLPAFAPLPQPAGEADVSPSLEGDGRIKKFAGSSTRKPALGKAKPFAADRERRPFDRARGPVRKPAAKGNTSVRPGKSTFNRPWDEERAARAARTQPFPSETPPKPEFQDIDLDASGDATPTEALGAQPRPSRPTSDRPKKPSGKPPFGDRKKSFGDRKPFGDRAKPSFNDPSRPSFRDRSRADRPAFGDRPRAASDDRNRRDAGKPSFGDRPRAGGGDRPAFSRNREGRGADRPAFRPDTDRPFRARPDSGAEGPASSKRPPRPSFDRKSGGGKPAIRPTGDRPFRPRPETGAESRPPRRDFSGKSFDRPPRPRPEGSEGGRPPFKRFDARPPRSGGFSARPSPSGKRPFAAGPSAKPGSGARSEGPFDKFKGNNKPWGKRPPKRKIKPEEDQAG